VTITNKGDFQDLRKDIQVRFKTLEQNPSKFLYQRNEKLFPGKVAVMAQFLPSFSAAAGAQTAGKIAYTTEDDELEEDSMKENLEHKMCFTFVVDRSGSMSGGRIEITKQALKLFLQSLPTGSYFQIISFGSRHDFMQVGGRGMIEYNDRTSQAAQDMVQGFAADCGGTQIYEPMNTAFNEKLPAGIDQKRIFMLTDGAVSSPQSVIELIRQRCEKDDTVRVYSFGIGHGCSEYLVQECATAGKGNCCLVRDDEMGLLKEKVVDSLRRAGLPALQGCTFDFGSDKDTDNSDTEVQLGNHRDLGSLYRNELVRCFALLPEEKFSKLRCNFKSSYDPDTKKPVQESFSVEQFQEMKSDEASQDLFKLAAKNAIDLCKGDDDPGNAHKIATSVKYQVLCDHTSFVGMKKNKTKNSMEVRKVVMPTMTQMSKSSFS
jgi:hypothetical protein